MPASTRARILCFIISSSISVLRSRAESQFYADFSRIGFRNLFYIPFLYDPILLYFYLKVKLNLSLKQLFCIFHKRILFELAIFNKHFTGFVVQFGIEILDFRFF
jgi:hypothetical protein